MQDAAFQKSAINYQNTVLRAAAEVESKLYGFLKAREQLTYLTESVKSVRQSHKLSMIQHKEGRTDFLRVDVAAANLSRQQDSQATVAGRVATNLIGAYKALGGGWELRLGREFIPEAMIKEMRSRTKLCNILAAPDYSPRRLGHPGGPMTRTRRILPHRRRPNPVAGMRIGNSHAPRRPIRGPDSRRVLSPAVCCNRGRTGLRIDRRETAQPDRP